MRMSDYEAANRTPWKLLHSPVLRDGEILPVHPQLIPTNRCNGGCSYCGCGAVDRSKEMSVDEARRILRYFAKLGTRALTISGGGDPTLHPGLPEILDTATELGMRVGLVTNGLAWMDLPEEKIRALVKPLTWLRLSIVRTDTLYSLDSMEALCRKIQGPMLGLNFVVAKTLNARLAAAVCTQLGSLENVRYVHFVENFLDPCWASMQVIKRLCAPLSSKVALAYRDRPDEGAAVCLVSKLRPNIDVDGWIYPCCLVQGATEEKACNPPSMRMCHWEDFHKMPPFAGSVCQKCFFRGYNEALDNLLTPPEHLEFV